MADELVEGVFRAIFALSRAIANFLIEILRDVLGDLIVRGLAHIFLAFAQAIGFLIRLTLWAAEVVLLVVFRRPIGKRTALVYGTAMGAVMITGFYIGGTAAVLYHADWRAPAIVAATDVER